ncbi:imidazole glycerol phosphate synthase subunit HisF [Myroides sp. LJL119]
MVDKKIIACLDIKDNCVVKGINFENIQRVGDPLQLALWYESQGVDELVFLDISASLKKEEINFKLVKQISDQLSIPLTVGGAINHVDQANRLLDHGASKVSINSGALENGKLISQLANALGKQRVVVAIDVKKHQDNWWVYSHGGQKRTPYLAVQWAKEVEQLGGGEILLTSMDQDGCQKGFSIDITQRISQIVDIPVIASGGAGRVEDFVELFTKTNAQKALAASIFHYNTVAIPELKKAIISK